MNKLFHGGNVDVLRRFVRNETKTFFIGDALPDEVKCRDNKYRCANPGHLRQGSKKDNRIDENIAGKTISHKNDRKKRFQELVEESSKAERKNFYDILCKEFSRRQIAESDLSAPEVSDRKRKAKTGNQMKLFDN